MQHGTVTPDQIRLVYATALFAWGSCTGSLLNVVILRLPKGESLVDPPSHCPACGSRVRLIDLFPILNWLWLRGRCRDCGRPIHWRYPLIEAATAGVCAWMGYHLALSDLGLMQNTGVLVSFLVAACLLLPTLVIGLDGERVPWVLPALGLGGRLLSAWWLPGWWEHSSEIIPKLPIDSFYLTLLGALVGGVPLLALMQTTRDGPGAERRPVGLGDIMLGAFGGSLFGGGEALLLLGGTAVAVWLSRAVARSGRGTPRPPSVGTILAALTLAWLLWRPVASAASGGL